MLNHQLFLAILIFANAGASAQQTNHNHVAPLQEKINDALNEAYENSVSRPCDIQSSELISNQWPGSPFSVLQQMEHLKNGERISSNQESSILQIDTLFIGDIPHDTLVINGNYTHNGPVFIFNDGVLILHHAILTNVGDVFVFGHGTLLADSSSLFFPQQYFYQRSLVAVQNSYVRMETCSLSYGGFSHNLLVADSASFELNDIIFNDWTTAGLFGHPTITIHGVNLGGEYILSGNATVTMDHVNTLLLWNHFPDTAVINYSFPPGAGVNNFTFNNSVAGIAGIGYRLNVDSCTNVMWGLMPVNGSDVTVSNSTIRSIGAWFQHGDSVGVSGLVDNSNYTNFTAPLSDRNLHLINSSVQTWSLYVFDSSMINISSSILGEVGCQGSSRAISSQFFLDGSGGYFWDTDTSFIVASSVSVTSHVRSERNGVFVFGYSSLTGGIASAIGNSVMIVVQSALPQDPVAYDGSVAWLANIAQPSTALVDVTIPVSGSAWIDQGPLGSFMDFGSYSLYYQQQGTVMWSPLVIDSASEIRNNTLAMWTTVGLPAGNYLLRLVLKDNLGDSVEAIKGVTLLPSILPVNENSNGSFKIKLDPDLFSNEATFEINLKEPETIIIAIVDLFGNQVQTIINSGLGAGINRVMFNASSYTNGIYFYHGFSKNKSVSGKFVVQH